MKRIDVGHDFYHRLANRDRSQGDGEHTAEEFRKKYLATLDNEDVWKTSTEPIILDFSNVRKIGPSFANEAFAYFTKYVSPDEIKKRILFENTTSVQRNIIMEELETGYKRVK